MSIFQLLHLQEFSELCHQHPLFDKSSREICFEPQSEILCSPSSQNNGHSMFLALFAVFGGITTGRVGISGKIVHVLKVDSKMEGMVRW